jgi:hypothetical protein
VTFVRRLTGPRRRRLTGSAIVLRGTSRRIRTSRPRDLCGRRRRRVESYTNPRNGRPGMGSYRQQTQAKAARERTLRERPERKLEKKRAAAAERRERAAPTSAPQFEDSASRRA